MSKSRISRVAVPLMLLLAMASVPALAATGCIVANPASVQLAVNGPFSAVGDGPVQRVSMTRLPSWYWILVGDVRMEVSPLSDGGGHVIPVGSIWARHRYSNQFAKCNFNTTIMKYADDESWFDVTVAPEVASLAPGTYTGSIRLIVDHVFLGSVDHAEIPFSVVIWPRWSVNVNLAQLEFDVPQPGVYQATSPAMVTVESPNAQWSVRVSLSAVANVQHPEAVIGPEAMRVRHTIPWNTGTPSQWFQMGELPTLLFSGAQYMAPFAKLEFSIETDYSVMAGEYRGELVFTLEPQ